MVSISSIAANKPVDDANYSAVKGGIQSFFRSISLKSKQNQCVFSIAPSTINDNMRKRIAEIILEDDHWYNGVVIELYGDESTKWNQAI